LQRYFVAGYLNLAFYRRKDWKRFLESIDDNRESDEVQKYYQKPIEIIQNECFTMNEYRQKASVVLDRLLKIQYNSVISGTPSGLRDSYLQI